MKKLFSLLLASLVLVSLAGCSNTDEENDNYKVAVLYTSYLGDLSWNDSAHAGIVRALDELENVEVKEFETNVAAEWDANAVAACEDGYDLIVGVAWQYADIFNPLAEQYPDIKFAVMDGVMEDRDNTMSAIFAQNEGSFLAGAAATMFTTHTEIDGINSEVVIGWVGGMEIPVLEDFFTGYTAGAQYIDPDVVILQSYVGAWADPVGGLEATKTMYSQGADIVMNVASGTGIGVLEAAAQEGKYAIGVDADQDHLQPGSILTSMLKRVDVGVYTAIVNAANGTFVSGINYFNVANGGIGLTDMSVMKEALGDQFPQEILDKIIELTEKIANGDIVVPNYEGFGNPNS